MRSGSESGGVFRKSCDRRVVWDVLLLAFQTTKKEGEGRSNVKFTVRAW